MADEIKAGSIVRLKSDGPDMTVDSVNTVDDDDDDESPSQRLVATCVWFVKDKGLLRSAEFSVSSLVLVTE